MGFQLSEFFRLLWGTVLYRPYVYAFFSCFLVFAIFHMGKKRTVFFLVVTWCIAWLSEYSSTNGGVFPFGEYYYIDTTRHRELWVANVPFWDSLSFVFLSFFSFLVAASILGIQQGYDVKRSPWPSLFHKGTPVLGGFLMMLLDVVIDPVALQGEKWFLGQVYGYPHGGFYFGVTLANFLGWFFVGWLTQTVFQVFLKATSHRWPWRPLSRHYVLAVVGVYAGILGFNLFMTFWIQDFALGKVSTLVASLTLSAIFFGVKQPVSPNHSQLDDASGKEAFT